MLWPRYKDYLGSFQVLLRPLVKKYFMELDQKSPLAQIKRCDWYNNWLSYKVNGQISGNF